MYRLREANNLGRDVEENTFRDKLKFLNYFYNFVMKVNQVFLGSSWYFDFVQQKSHTIVLHAYNFMEIHAV